MYSTHLYFSEECVGWIETVQLLMILLLVETTTLSEKVGIKTEESASKSINYMQI